MLKKNPIIPKKIAPKSIQDSTVGSAISSINYLNWLSSVKNIYETININNNDLLKSLNNEDLFFNEDIISLKDKISKFSLNENEKLFNFYLGKDYIQQEVVDPVSLRKYNNSNYMSYKPNLGLSLSEKNIKKIPISNVFLDRANSFIDEIMHETFSVINENLLYKLIIKSVNSNLTNNFFSIRGQQQITISLQFEGIHSINQISLSSSSELEIQSIKYLSTNSNYVEIDNYQLNTGSVVNINFNTINASNMFITFIVKNPLDTIIDDSNISYIYSLDIKDINIFYITYDDVSFAITDSMYFNDLTSLKIQLNLEQEEQDHILSCYALINSSNGFRAISLHEDYSLENEEYFQIRNNQFVLDYIPETLSIYKNDQLLSLGIDYTLKTSLSESEFALSEIDSSKKQYLTITIVDYSFIDFYHIKIKPIFNTSNINHCMYTNDSIIFDDPLKTAKLQLLFIYRINRSFISTIPIIKSVLLKVA